MTLDRLLKRLEQIHLESEAKGNEDGVFTMEVMDVLLDYINNTKIREAVENIPL